MLQTNKENQQKKGVGRLVFTGILNEKEGACKPESLLKTKINVFTDFFASHQLQYGCC